MQQVWQQFAEYLGLARNCSIPVGWQLSHRDEPGRWSLSYRAEMPLHSTISVGNVQRGQFHVTDRTAVPPLRQRYLKRVRGTDVGRVAHGLQHADTADPIYTPAPYEHRLQEMNSEAVRTRRIMSSMRQYQNDNSASSTSSTPRSGFSSPTATSPEAQRRIQQAFNRHHSLH